MPLAINLCFCHIRMPMRLYDYVYFMRACVCMLYLSVCVCHVDDHVHTTTYIFFNKFNTLAPHCQCSHSPEKRTSNDDNERKIGSTKRTRPATTTTGKNPKKSKYILFSAQKRMNRPEPDICNA